MSKFYWATIPSCILMVACGSSGSTSSGESNQSNKGNILDATQKNFGNWTPDEYVSRGWRGYHIVAQAREEKPYATWESGTGDSKTTHVETNDRCLSGDCPEEQKITIYSILGPRGRIAQQEVIGGAHMLDDGKQEDSEVLLPNNVAIVRIDETEAQSKLRLTEAQTSTFTAFNDVGVAHPVGYIEEMDAPGTRNQPESIYELQSDGSKKFLGTVVERIGFGTVAKASEYFRLGTVWCMSDAWKLSKGISQVWQNDSFDMSKCNEADRPLVSTVKGDLGTIIQQAGTGRSNSLVSIRDPQTGQPVNYETDSDTNTFYNGTRYKIIRNGRNVAFVNTHVFKEKTDDPNAANNGYRGEINQPKGKLVTFNVNKKSGWEGIGYGSDGKAWLEGNDGEKGALLVYEKTGEVNSRINGKPCNYGQGTWGDNSAADPDLQEMSEQDRVRTCEFATTYTLNFYILFPPSDDVSAQIDRLDAFLAAMPDQTQSSPELDAAEQYLDYIRALNVFAKNRNPADIGMELMVDINTEEDSLSVLKKVPAFIKSLD